MTTPTIERWKSKRFGGVGCPKLGTRKRAIRGIVLHSTEGRETKGSAAASCAWFDNPKAGGNAHYCCDANTVIQYADDCRPAWHASAANQWSIGVEIVGRAAQSPDEWLDPYSLATLDNAARLCAILCNLHGIEVRKLTPSEILSIHAGPPVEVSGFLGHVDVTRVLKSGSHTDPGPSFPYLEFLLAVRGYIELGAT